MIYTSTGRKAQFYWLVSILILLTVKAQSQTADDGLMMHQSQACGGLMITHTAFDQFWEGTVRRDNLNYGTVSTLTTAFMGIYGITERMNILVTIPYVVTEASAGTLHGMSGLQDISLMIKYHAASAKTAIGTFRLYGLAGYSFPGSDYLADYLPLAIGAKSQTLSTRILTDFETHHFFATASYWFALRGNITIDRNAYYTTQYYITNQVSMPNVAGWMVRSGYRSTHFIAELFVQSYTTLGGFDIRKNDLPFPSNRVEWKSLGANLKYEFHKPLRGVSVYAGGSYAFQGRNTGQINTLDGGIFYAFNL